MISKTAIVLCTYNGELFIKEQLESYANQTCSDWELYVYDDGSTDHTAEIIAQFQKSCPGNPVHWRPNKEKRGFAHNFINGIRNTSDHADYYALSDQDDIWCPSKIQRAKDILKEIPSETPAVYCSRTLLVDEHDHEIGLSPLFTRPPSFQNALVQSIAGGNTMVLNKAARHLLLRADTHGAVVSHDWLIYQLVTGAGGVVYYDPQPEIRYRQHGANIIGTNRGLFARLYRMTNLFNGTFKTWIDKNVAILNQNKSLLSVNHQHVLDSFIAERKKGMISKLFSFYSLGIYRQQSIDNLAIYLAWVISCL